MYHLRLACLLLTVCLQQVLPEQEQRWIDHWSACNATTQPFSEQQQQPGGLPPNVHLSTSQSLEQTSDEPEISKPAHRFNISNLKPAKLHGVCKGRTAPKVVKKVHADEIKQPSNQSTQQKMEASSDPGASEDSSSIQNPAEVIRGVFDALAPEMKVGGNPLVPFMDLGLGSLEMEAVADGLTKALGTTVNPPMLFDYPCLQALTGHFTASTGPSQVVRKQRKSESAIITIAGVDCCRSLSTGRMFESFCQAHDPVEAIPFSRFDTEELEEHGLYVKHGHFLPEVEMFDNEYFSLGSQQARLLDPHQRLLLESATNALSRSGTKSRCCSGRR